ncbi:hypothetical protein Zm00014a_039593 [Zea mays]|uniref:Uncharacterized protein n=1 Tax=Zea mays TaxID=4577 RepID=A0A3L6FFF1_MAIZE|nr:hypothetical protein Zm00014a_039593 [Zea mays]
MGPQTLSIHTKPFKVGFVKLDADVVCHVGATCGLELDQVVRLALIRNDFYYVSTVFCLYGLQLHQSK